MTFALLAVSALAPSLLLVWYFHARDAFREPPRVLWTTFALGILIVGPVLVFAWPMTLLGEAIGHPVLSGLVTAFLGAAIPEEAFKLLVLWGYSMRRPAFDEEMDGIVYGAVASLGFATFENVLYVAEGGGSAAILRAVTAVPGHAFLGAIMGFFVGRARFAGGAERRAYLRTALLVPILLHGLYDFPLMAAAGLETPDSAAAVPVLLLLVLVPAVLALEWIWTLRLVRRARAAQLAGGPPGAPAAPTRAPASVPRPAAAEPLAAVPAAGSWRDNVAGWALTLAGGFIASVGGLVLFAVTVAVIFGGAAEEEAAALAIGTVIIGVLPAAAGAGLFFWGLKRLNRA